MHKIGVTEITEGWPCPHCPKILRGPTISHLNNHIKTVHEGKALCFVESKGKAKRQGHPPTAPDPRVPVVCTFDFPQMGAVGEATGPFQDYPVTFVTREIPGRKYLAGSTTSPEDSAILRAISGELFVTCEQAFEMYLKSWNSIEISFDPLNKKAVSILAAILSGRSDGRLDVHDHSLGVYTYCNGKLIMTTDRGKSVFIPIPADDAADDAMAAEEVAEEVVAEDDRGKEASLDVEVVVNGSVVSMAAEEVEELVAEELAEEVSLRRKRNIIMVSSDDDDMEVGDGGRKRSKESPVSVDEQASQDSVMGFGDPLSSEVKVADIKVPTSAMVNPSTVPYLFKRGMEMEKSVDRVIMGTSADYVMAFLEYMKPLGLLRFALNAVKNKEKTVSKRCFELLANQLRGAKKTQRMILNMNFSTKFIKSLQLIPPGSRKKKFTTLQIFEALSQNCDFEQDVYDQVLEMAEYVVPLLEIQAISDGAEYPMTWMEDYLQGKPMRDLRDLQMNSPMCAPVKKGLLKKYPSTYPGISHFYPDVKCPPSRPYPYFPDSEVIRAYSVEMANFEALHRKDYDIALEDWKRERQNWGEQCRQYNAEMDIFRRRQKYISFAGDVWDYFTYRMTWTVSPGTYSTLQGIFRYAYKRLVAAAKQKKVLQESVTIKIKGESTESALQSSQWPWLSHDEAFSKDDISDAVGEGESENDIEETGTCRTRLRITIDEGSVVDAVVPFMKLVLSSGKLNIFLRNSQSADGRNILSRRPSLVIARDGSAEGTDRAKAIVPFLNAWNSQPAAVSQTLGDLLGFCIFCSLPITRKESLERGSGDKCFRKFGLTEGLVLEETKDGTISRNVDMNTAEAGEEQLSCTMEDETQQTLEDEKIVLLIESRDGTVFPVHQGSKLMSESKVLKDMQEDLGGSEMCPTVRVPFSIAAITAVDRACGGVADNEILLPTKQNIEQMVEFIRAGDFLEITPKHKEGVFRALADCYVGCLDV